MSSALTIDGKEYVTAVVAGKQFGYTKDYFLMLAKQGKINGQKIGNKWYIDIGSAELFFNQAKKRKAERSQKVRVERKAELKKHSQVKHKGYARAALVETLVILIIGFSLGATGYIGTTSNTASVQAGEFNFLENVAISIYEFFSPSSTILVGDDVSRTSSVDGVPPGTQITYTSLVVAPDEVFTATTIDSVRESFSDEVEVSVDPDNPDTGIIIPVFRDRKGEPYRFLMVPVTEASTQ